jgi:enoyl-CoA hydratase
VTAGEITAQRSGDVLVVTLDAPRRRNALTAAMLRQLHDVFVGLRSEASVRAVVITGAGDLAFCAGADLAEVRAAGESGKWQQRAFGQQAFTAMEELPKPVIAAVNGYAIGGGTELAVACDMRYASNSAVFQLPEVGLGGVPGWGGSHRVARLIGPGRTYEFIFTGRQITAAEAEAIGLVNAVLPDRDLLTSTLDIAHTIAGKDPDALAAAKAAVQAFGRSGATLSQRFELQGPMP